MSRGGGAKGFVSLEAFVCFVLFCFGSFSVRFGLVWFGLVWFGLLFEIFQCRLCTARTRICNSYGSACEVRYGRCYETAGMVRVCTMEGREGQGYSQITSPHHFFLLLHRHFLHEVLRIGVVSV